MTIYDFVRGKKTNTLVVRDLAIRIQLPAPLSLSRLVSAVFWHCPADAHIFADAFHCRCTYRGIVFIRTDLSLGKQFNAFKMVQ